MSENPFESPEEIIELQPKKKEISEEVDVFKVIARGFYFVLNFLFLGFVTCFSSMILGKDTNIENFIYFCFFAGLSGMEIFAYFGKNRIAESLLGIFMLLICGLSLLGLVEMLMISDTYASSPGDTLPSPRRFVLDEFIIFSLIALYTGTGGMYESAGI